MSGLFVPNEGAERLLLEILAGGTARENWTLRLYKNNKTPAESDTMASYTEADFTNYVSKTLTRTINNGVTWNTITVNAPTGGWAPSGNTNVAESTYQAQSWTCGSSGNTVYGYVIEGATSAKCIGAELFAVARVLANSDVLNLTPRFGVAHS